MRTWRQGVIIATARRARGSIRVLRQQSHIRRGPQITENDTVSPITAAGARPGRESSARTGLGSIWSWPAVFGPAILRHPPSVAESIVAPFPERCEQHTRPPRVAWQPVPGKPGVLLRLTSLHQPAPGVKRLRSSPSGRRPSHPSPRSLPPFAPCLGRRLRLLRLTGRRIPESPGVASLASLPQVDGSIDAQPSSCCRSASWWVWHPMARTRVVVTSGAGSLAG